MGVSITLCIILSLTLYVGWKWYFDNLTRRTTLIDLAKKAEKRVQDLENLGLSFDPASNEASTLPSTLPKIAGSSNQTLSTGSSTTPVSTQSAQDSPFPADSAIRELPLAESSEEVVQALALLDKYWKTTSWKERVPMVADSARVGRLMQDYYDNQGGKEPAPGNLLGKARYQIDGTEILYFSYSSSRPTGSLEIAMLRSGPQGEFLIDWESLTGYGEMSFLDFRTQRPVKPVLMRAYVRLFEYYNYEFSDAKKYLCVKLMSESGESSVYAYCERGTKLASWLETDLASTGPNGFKGYTMLVSFPPNAQSNQCINLDKVVTQRWLKLP